MAFGGNGTSKIGILIQNRIVEEFARASIKVHLPDGMIERSILGHLEDEIYRQNKTVKTEVLYVNEISKDKLQEFTLVHPFISDSIEHLSTLLEEMRILISNPITAIRTAVDKIEAQKVWEKNSVPTPKTLITEDFYELLRFVRSEKFALLKNPWGRGGDGHVPMLFENGELIGHVAGKQYPCKLNDEITLKKFSVRVNGGILLNPPFLIQNFISSTERPDVNKVVFRAYVINKAGINEPARYEVVDANARVNEKIDTLGDSVIACVRGASYHFKVEGHTLEDIFGADAKGKDLLTVLGDSFQDVAISAARALGTNIVALDILMDNPNGNVKHNNFRIIDANVDGPLGVIDRGPMSFLGYAVDGGDNSRHNFDRHLADFLVNRSMEQRSLMGHE